MSTQQILSKLESVSRKIATLFLRIDAVEQGVLLEIDTTPTQGSNHAVSSNALYNVKAALALHPSYISPTLVLSSSQSTLNLEIGQTISVPLVSTFNQNDAGSIVSTSIFKDGAQIASGTPYTDPNLVVSSTPVVYSSTASYLQGAIKNSNFGDPDSTGRISAGTINSNTLSYRGHYKHFFGPVASQPANSASVRSLSSQFDTNSSITLNTGTSLINFAVWVSGTHSIQSVIDLDALNVDITSNYVLVNNSLQVNDAAGTPVTGKLYMLSQSVPYTSNHRHQINIA